MGESGEMVFRGSDSDKGKCISSDKTCVGFYLDSASRCYRAIKGRLRKLQMLVSIGLKERKVAPRKQLNVLPRSLRCFRPYQFSELSCPLSI